MSIRLKLCGQTERGRTMKLRHLPILYTIYLLFLIAFFGIIRLSGVIMTIAILVICGAIFLIASSITVGLTLIAVNNQKQQQELRNRITANTKTPTDILREHMHTLTGMQPGKPPINAYINTLIDSIRSMIDRLSNINKLLETTFSKTDLTYITYVDAIGNVTELFISNVKSAMKRMSVFDYNAWKAGERSDISQKYISDIEVRISQNDDILDKLDCLISELVSLDDPSNFSLDNITSLIQQTQDYKNINNGGTLQ